MYKNLRAEMMRQNVSVQMIGDALKLKADTIRRKLSGNVNFTISECLKVASLFKENNSLDYLFETSDEK